MSGHNKWSQIKRQKGAADIKRGQIFTKLGRAITVAVRESGGVTDSEKNFKLRLAIEKAREINMPKGNIQRAIDRAIGKGEGGSGKLEEALYEAYGPFGVALLIETVTDNKQRTAAAVKHLLERTGGHLSTPGAVSYLFKRQGLLVVEADDFTADQILEKVLESGAEDLETGDDGFEIYTQDTKLHELKEKLEKSGLKIKTSELIFHPTTTISITDKDQGTRILKLMESLEELDDVQRVFANFDIPKELTKKIN